MDMDQIIRTAISQKKLLGFVYEARPRIVEPHIYGKKDGRYGILAYQVDGESSGKLPDWRRMYLKKISGDITILDKTFLGKRPTAGKHSEWDEIYCIVS